MIRYIVSSGVSNYFAQEEESQVLCICTYIGVLQIAVHKVPQFQVDGKGKVIISDKDRKNAENLSCTFYGDFVLKTHPGESQCLPRSSPPTVDLTAEMETMA